MRWRARCCQPRRRRRPWRWKRAPSSFVQLTTPTGYSASTQLSASAFSISTPAVMPSMLLYLPLVGWVSRREPANMGRASLRRPGHTAKILPIASMVVWQPSAWVASTNQSRACLSASERARRHMPVSVGALPHLSPEPHWHV